MIIIKAEYKYPKEQIEKWDESKKIFSDYLNELNREFNYELEYMADKFHKDIIDAAKRVPRMGTGMCEQIEPKFVDYASNKV